MLHITEVVCDTNGMTTYFVTDPPDGSEAQYLGWATNGQGGLAKAREAFLRQVGLDCETVSIRKAPRPPREATTPQGLAEVAQGCWSTPGNEVVVVELRNGAWVRVPGRGTGRGPEGDAIRYEPSLGMAIAWADRWLAQIGGYRNARRV